MTILLAFHCDSDDKYRLRLQAPTYLCTRSDVKVRRCFPCELKHCQEQFAFQTIFENKVSEIDDGNGSCRCKSLNLPVRYVSS